ncbi:MAG: S-layer family protein [Calothrix sp. SM1_7_51]|nr:S-layer family protein [Calothrix sp. SM1_7_51]
MSFPDTIQRGDVVFTNKAPANRSGIDVRFGNGGDIGVTGRNISLFSGSQLRAGIASGLGTSASRGGDVVVNATGEIRMTGEDTRMANDLRENAIGKAGDIAVTANSLVLTDGAQLSSSTFGTGDGGNVVIAADRVSFDGVRADEQGVSGAFSRVESRARGNGGTVQIFTQVLEVTNGAGLFSATLGFGDGGNIIIKASDRVSFNGVSPVRKIPSRAVSDVPLRRAQGKGGNLEIFTKTLEVTNDAQLSASTFGIGNAGNILIDATSNVKIAGDFRFAGVFVASFTSGNAGDITINTPKISLDQGVVSAESASVNGGNVTLNIRDILELKNTSSISATAGDSQFGGNGGNIVIHAPDAFIAAFPNENSDITANAFSGSGGKITINTKGIFGIAPLTRDELVNLLGTSNSEELDPAKLRTNDIVAFSQQKPDLSGEVIINTNDADPSRGLIQLPSNLVDSSQQIAPGCTPRPGSASRFISTGRGGLPLSPEQPLRGRAVITNWVALPEEKLTNREINQPLATSTTKSTEQIIEAQGWIVDAKGNVIFVAQSPLGISSKTNYNLLDCAHLLLSNNKTVMVPIA